MENSDYVEEYSDRAQKAGENWLKENEGLLKSIRNENSTMTQQVSSRELPSNGFKAEGYAPSDPFSPLNGVPQQSKEERNEIMGINAGQARALDSALEVAQNWNKVLKVENSYVNADLTRAKTQNLDRQIHNERLKGLQYEQAGQLIAAKTEGLLLLTEQQSIRNETQRALNSLERVRGGELILQLETEIKQLRAATDSRVSALQASYLSAGEQGGYGQVDIQQLDL